MQPDKLARSFVLGLSGVVGAYVVQFLASADLGPYLTPLVAAMTPVAVNYVRMLWSKWFPAETAGQTVILSPDQLRELLLSDRSIVIKDLQQKLTPQTADDPAIVL